MPKLGSARVSPSAPAVTRAYGATYTPSSSFPVAPSYHGYGYETVTIKNTSNFVWTPSTVALGYHMYRSDNSVYNFTGVLTLLTVNVAVGASVSLPATIDAMPAGSFKLVWDMYDLTLQTSQWFTNHGVPASTAVVLSIPHYPPALTLDSPLDGATVGTLDPQFELSVYGDATSATSVDTQVCVYANNDPGTTCWDSGWQSVTISGQSFYGPARWQPPATALFWDKTYYWHARVKDTASTGPWSGFTSFATALPAPAGPQHFGADPASLDVAGVNLFQGNWVQQATDLSMPTMAAPLAVSRTYNSSSAVVGGFGVGWSSPLDVQVTSDASIDGSAVLQAHYADGKIARYGENPDGTWAPAYGAGADAVIKNIQSFTLPDGSQYAFSIGHHSGNFPIASVTFANGDTQVYTTDANDRVTSVRDSASGRTLYITWTGTHVSSVSNAPVGAPAALTWTYNYSGDDLTSACDADSPSNCTFYVYGGSPDAGDSNSYDAGLLVREQNATYATTSVRYGAAGVVSVAKPGGSGYESTTWTYSSYAPPPADVNGSKIVLVTDPMGTDTHYEFDLSGGLIFEWLGADVSTPANTRGWLYDLTGRPAALIDENGNDTEWDWIPGGGLNTTRRYTDNRGDTTTISRRYDYPYSGPSDWRSNLVTGVVESDSAHVTDYSYDTRGLLLSTTLPPTSAAPNGEVTTNVYTCAGGTAAPSSVDDSGPVGSQPCNLLSTQTDPAGGITRFGYDTAGDLTRTVTPAGLSTEQFYDAAARVTKRLVTTPPSGTAAETDYTYNGDGQVLTETDPLVTNPITGIAHQLQTSNTYDQAGHPVTVLRSDLTPQAAGGDAPRRIDYSYDPAGRLAGTIDNGVLISFIVYNALGAVESNFSSNASLHYTYDTLSRLITVSTGNTPLQSYTYDPAGRVASSTDAMGETVSYTYTTDDLKASETMLYRDPVSGSTRSVALHAYTYNTQRDLLSDTAGTGTNARVTTMTYDQVNRLLSSTADPGGLNRATTISYDTAGRRAGTSLSDGSRTESSTVSYNQASQVIGNTVANGTSNLITSDTYDAAGHPLSVTDPRGATGDPSPYTATASYDLLGRLSASHSAPVATEDGTPGAAPVIAPVSSAFGYNAFGELSQTRDGNGNVTATSYDTDGRKISVSYPSYTPPNGAAVTPTESWTYDEVSSDATSHTDRAGHTTSYTYNGFHQVATITQPPATAGGQPGVSTLVHDYNGNLLSAIDPTGAQTLYTYDGMDRQASRTQVVRVPGQPSVQDTTSFGHDDFGDLTSVTGPTVQASATYDNAGELASFTQTGRGTARYGYDLAGRLTSQSDFSGRTTTTSYDLAGRTTSNTVSGAGGQLLLTSRNTVDQAGNTTSVTDPNSNTWTASFDALNRVTGRTDPAPSSATGTLLPAPRTSFGYDPNGDTTRVTDANNNSTYQTYNSLNLPQTRTVPATTAQPGISDRSFTTSYTADGSPSQLSEPGGVTVTDSYDQLGRLTAQTGTGADAAASRAFGYDAAGRLTSAGTPTGTQTFGYDDRGLLTASAGPDGSASYSYDTGGRMSASTDAAGTNTYTYNAATTDLHTAADSLSGTTRTYGYTPDGAVSNEADATSAGAAGSRAYTYDALGRIASDTTSTSTGVLSLANSYSWDPDNNLLTATTSGATLSDPHTSSYSYDTNNRLIRSVSVPAGASTGTGTDYSWDGAGNRLTALGWTGTAASHTTTVTSSYSYDQRDRILSAATPTGTTAYTWTPRGTLDASTSTPAAGAPSSTDYQFDALGRMIADGAVSYSYDSLDRTTGRTQSGASTAFSYSGTGLEPVSDGTITTSRGPDGQPLATASAAAGTTRPLSNAHGDITASVSPGTAALTASSTFADFGVVTSRTGAAPGAGFQGSWTDPATGLVHAQARWYDPASATFLSADTSPPPLSGAASANLYGYGQGNPTSTLDPSGHNPLGSLLGDFGTAASDTADFVGSVLSDIAALPTFIGDATAAGAAALESAEGVATVLGSAIADGTIAGAAALSCALVCVVLATGLLVIAIVAVGYGLYRLFTTQPDPINATPPVTARGQLGQRAGRDTPPPVQVHLPAPVTVTGTRTTTTTTSWTHTSKYFDDTYTYTRLDTYSFTTTYRYTYYSNGAVASARPIQSAISDAVRITRQLLIDLNHPAFTATFHNSNAPNTPDTTPATPGSGTCGAGGPVESCASNGQKPLPSGALTPPPTNTTPDTTHANCDDQPNETPNCADSAGTGQSAADQAASFQGQGDYPGVDNWENVTLHAGDVVHAGEPGLSGFAASDQAAAFVGNDAHALNEGLQIAARNGTYRPGLTAFRLIENVQAGRSIALANPQFGAGGLEQFFIPNFADVTEPLVTRLMFGGPLP